MRHNVSMIVSLQLGLSHQSIIVQTIIQEQVEAQMTSLLLWMPNLGLRQST